MENKELMPAKNREQTLESSAIAIAEMGYRLDANAPLTLELRIDSGGGVQMTCTSRVLKDGKGVVSSKAMHTGMNYPSGLLALPEKGAIPDLPRLLFRDANLKRLFVPLELTFGVDGLLEPEVNMPEDLPDMWYGPQDVK